MPWCTRQSGREKVLFLGVCHVAGNGLFVGGTNDSVEADMELVACTITFGAFSANIEPVGVDRITAASWYEIYSSQIF